MQALVAQINAVLRCFVMYCMVRSNLVCYLSLLQEAELAREKTNAYKLDRSHIFAVNMFEEFDKFMKVPDEWAPPEFKPYTPGVIASIYSYHVFCSRPL